MAIKKGLFIAKVPGKRKERKKVEKVGKTAGFRHKDKGNGMYEKRWKG